MPIYDHDGTAVHQIGKVYDHDGTAVHQIGKVYDHDGTSSHLIYSAELVLFDGGVQNGITWTAQTSSPISAGSGYYYQWDKSCAAVGTTLHVKDGARYTQNNNWYGRCGYLKSSAFDASGFTTCTITWSGNRTDAYAGYTTFRINSPNGSTGTLSGFLPVGTSGGTTSSFSFTGGTNCTIDIMCYGYTYNTAGSNLYISEIVLS